MTISCPKCDGRVEFEPPLKSNLLCPFCRAFLISVDPATGATWRPRQPWPPWARWGFFLGAVAAWGWIWIWWYNSSLNPSFVSIPCNGMVSPVFWVPILIGAWWGRRKGWLR